MKNQIKNMLKEILMKAEKAKNPLGVISAELVKEYQEWQFKNTLLDKEIQARIAVMKAEIELKLTQEFNQREVELDGIKRGLWEKICAELHIMDADNRELEINTRTGEIFEFVDEPQIDKDKLN